MKTLKVKSILFSLMAMMAVAVFLTSCSKEEAGILEDAVTTTETLTYKLSVPEGITAETTVEWFNQLSEEEIEAYLIEDTDAITLRNCTTWCNWSNWQYTSGLSCFSLMCPNSQSQVTYRQTRTRYRHCSSGTEFQTETIIRTQCGPPC